VPHYKVDGVCHEENIVTRRRMTGLNPPPHTFSLALPLQSAD